jgi:hypothetical protein
VPTISSTGLLSWGNQDGATVEDRPAGVVIRRPATPGPEQFSIRYKAAPATPYKEAVILFGCN